MKQTREHNEDGKRNDINHATVASKFFFVFFFLFFITIVSTNYRKLNSVIFFILSDYFKN